MTRTGHAPRWQVEALLHCGTPPRVGYDADMPTEEDTSDAPTQDRPMSTNTLMARKEELDTEKDVTAINADVERERIRSEERRALYAMVGKIVGGVLLIAGVSLAAYWATQGVDISGSKGDAAVTVRGGE